VGQRGKFRTCKYYEKDALVFYCPGCENPHTITITGNGSWSFDGNYNSPTISPSILSTGQDESGKTICHSFLKNGVLQFLDDCTHALKGQSVPLPELPDWLKD
jgi:hypothetical protein